MQICSEENEEGNIEYKRFFNNINQNKLNHLTAQMNWRINEGNGFCHYYLGICDDGTIYTDFTQERMDYTLDILKQMVDGCNSYIEYIKLNRINIDLNQDFQFTSYLWLDVKVVRKLEFVNEYRILLANFSLDKNNQWMNYKTIIHNHEKYLFFEYNETFINLIDFNLILYKDHINININDLNVPIININDYQHLDIMDIVQNNMIGNKQYIDNDIEFNIIYTNNYNNIIYGFLRKGILKVGMKINNVIIISIHNNLVDCKESIGPATISIKFI